MIRAELVSHLMRDKVNSERIADRVRESGDAPSLHTSVTRTGQSRDPAATGAEDVSDVIVPGADDAIQGRLVLSQHRGAIVVGKRVVRGCARNSKRIGSTAD